MSPNEPAPSAVPANLLREPVPVGTDADYGCLFVPVKGGVGGGTMTMPLYHH